MKKLHAVGAGIIGVALSATAAVAAAPNGAHQTGSTSEDHGRSSTVVSTDESTPTDNHGAAVSTVARDSTQVGGEHDNHGGAVSAVAREAEGPGTDESTPDAEENSQKPTDNHGAAVSAVAKDPSQIGGKNENHGGAVSAVAHKTHAPNEHADGNANEHAKKH